MLHLLPIRLILWIFAATAALSVLGFAYAGWFSEGALSNLSMVVRWVGTLVPAGIILMFAGWRWIPSFQSSIFPYLGGRWTGIIEFKIAGVTDTREATLEIKHVLTGISMILETAESVSRTLLVHAEKDRDFDRYRLFYVYLNERKEGLSGHNSNYRGLAILRVESGSPLRLVGDYFTDTHRQGTLTMKRAENNPWWKLWR
jgi:hypothetical protein